MSLRFPTLVCVMVLGLCTAARGTPQPDAVTLTVSTGARSLPPGGVALISVHSSQPLTAIDGRGFGRAVRFWPDAEHTSWDALLASGLDAKPGTHTVSITGMSAGGSATATLPVRVVPKQYETRRLTVDPQFVNPPNSEGERIAREVKLMAQVFEHITPERLWHGAFEVPVPGEATSSFGRLSVMNGESRGRHQGADFRAATGTPVKAPNGGRVALAMNLYFSGNTVIIDHGLGMFSLLAHLSKISVEAGSTVSRGDILGDSGATGRVTGPHLHWALRIGEASVDPLALIAAVSSIPD